MFDPNSRYANVPDATLEVTEADGQKREVRYKRRRFLPPPDEGTTFVEHIVVQGDRLDVLTARYLGDPTWFWRLCDTNGVMNPAELTDKIGRAIRIALPKL
jgi:hypothetical protein